MADVLRFCLVAPRRILGPHFARASACADGPDSAESEKKVDVRTNCFNPRTFEAAPPLRGVKFGWDLRFWGEVEGRVTVPRK